MSNVCWANEPVNEAKDLSIGSWVPVFCFVRHTFEGFDSVDQPIGYFRADYVVRKPDVPIGTSLDTVILLHNFLYSNMLSVRRW